MRNETRRFGRKFLLWFWGIFSFIWVILISLFVLIALEYFGPLPTFEDLENPKSNIASEVISEDHVVLGYYYKELRSFVDYEELSPNLVNALIATEDIRFYRHSAIDARGIARVIVKTILMGQSGSGGGSTITQQLAKNLFPRDTALYRYTFVRKANLVITKFKEWITAVKLERNYTKNEILAMYMNTVAFGSNAYGIKSAAKTFFNTTSDSLRIEQAALLVGVVNAPTRYSPIRNPERSLERRNFVISQMCKYGFITEQQRDSISSIPIELNYKIIDHNVGLATYFRESLRIMLSHSKPERENYFLNSQYLEDSIEWAENPLFGWCHKNTKPDGSTYNLYRDGIKIYTTINSKMQHYAEQAVVEHIGGFLQPVFDAEQKEEGYTLFGEDLTDEQKEAILNFAIRQTERYRVLRNNRVSNDSIMRHFNTKIPMTIFTWKGERDTLMSPLDSIKHYKRHFRAGFMAVDPKTGHVKAWVGGTSFRHFKYDHVKQGRRQVGSTIKPFLYTLAMQEGYSPCHQVPNVPQTFVEGDSTWTPRNSGKSRYDGKIVTLKWGLSNSVNNISAWLIKRFTPQAVSDIIKKMGVKSKIMAVNSIFLGTSEVSLYEMVGAYSTFANKGVHIDPLIVTRIEDKNGNVLATFNPHKSEAISEQTAYLMLNLMEAVVNQGTAIRLRYRYNLEGHIAGKTGTTQNHSDGWFMGITPNIVGGVWVGAEDRGVRFKEIGMGQGANMALPIFALFLEKCYKDGSVGISPLDDWDKPLRVDHQSLDCPSPDLIVPEEKDIVEDNFF
ncbi:MAG TPA: transglycosylase domain-containing protein [Tenuifilaceae bacterium]|nr:transglycosylase domain-containing protein [Tenuifilaceae bacterium]HPE17436.1 transglycosylase domain-containing protein [Tenuifilaceae bacterium]HPJ45615.1 transglycosylase domain-containing protein [Tenuifilaceae bacterium]HPQ33485.1 transglycosylase domain-containing protein [Tenuifilaceae bacterium]HRX66982.1 transglycosylase domain-containing protein [Tenuifilaceae bacterium]